MSRLVHSCDKCTELQNNKLLARISLVHVVMQAIKEDYEVVICDTSGRLHTNTQLMDELAKCKRAIGKRMSQAPQEVLLVLDGTTGMQQGKLLLRVGFVVGWGKWGKTGPGALRIGAAYVRQSHGSDGLHLHTQCA